MTDSSIKERKRQDGLLRRSGDREERLYHMEEVIVNKKGKLLKRWVSFVVFGDNV
jgi:hypothetical protein